MFPHQIGMGFPSVFALLFILFNFLVGGFATKYAVEYWGSYLQKKRVHIPFIVAALASIVVAQITIPGAIVTWLLSYVITNDYY